MGEIFTVEDIRRSSWRDDYEEQVTRRLEKQDREMAEERERKARVAAEKQQVVTTNWYDAVDGRIHEHLKSWLWKAIDERIEQNLKLHFFSGDAGVGGAVKGGIWDATLKLLTRLREQFRASIRETVDAFGTEIAALEQRLVSNNQAALATSVDGCVKAALAHEHDAAGAVQRLLETKLVALEERLEAVPGRLPVAKIWLQESVTYEGEVVSYDGALWQACKDTAQAPGGSDWICVARAGRDGLTPNICGAFNVYKKYAELDVIEYEDASYVARRDNPGLCPGDGWQILSRSGRRGPVGERGLQGRKGERGARGEDAPTIVSWTLDRKNYCAVPTLSNGTQGAVLELRGLFEQFVEETR